jgi:hypothetical protein
MKKTLLYVIIGAAALTFVACEKKVEVTKEEEKKETTMKVDDHAAAKPAEEVKHAEKVEVNKADAQINPQPETASNPEAAKNNQQNEAAPAEQK